LSRRLAQHPVAALEVHAVAAAHRGVTEGRGQERLAHTDRAHDDDVVSAVDEAQRAQLGPGLVVVGDGRGVVPVLQAHGGVQPRRAGPKGRRAGLAPGDFVGQDELEELGVAHAARSGQGQALRQGVEGAAELDPAQQRLELG